ncbi:hypothetical protein ACSQ67_020982 [Phaseolus vulgaris]
MLRKAWSSTGNSVEDDDATPALEYARFRVKVLGEELVKEREALTDDVANSYMADFEDAVAQALGIYPEMDFSQRGLGKTVVIRQLVDE